MKIDTQGSFLMVLIAFCSLSMRVGLYSNGMNGVVVRIIKGSCTLVR